MSFRGLGSEPFGHPFDILSESEFQRGVVQAYAFDFRRFQEAVDSFRVDFLLLKRSAEVSVENDFRCALKSFGKGDVKSRQETHHGSSVLVNLTIERFHLL